MSFSERARRTALSALALAAAATGVLVASPADAAPRATPGSLTGYGFDTCAAPAQAVMDAWWQDSPYSAVGVYIGGSNRLCAQPELTAGWVKTQQRTGWHVLSLYVGPQASCSGYTDRMSSDLTTAGQQGRAEAAAAVAAARGLGIGRRSTLYYDLEDYDIGPDDCRRAALSFLSGWTQGLHAAGYDSGVYSNLAAAITSLDYANLASHGDYAMPDDIWFALANNRADTKTDARVKTSTWDDHARVHQYAVDEAATYGGYPLVIDSDWVDVGTGSVAPKAKPLCRGVDADLRRYPTLGPGRRNPAVKLAQCLLHRPLTGRYDARTLAAVKKAQGQLGLKPTGTVTRTTWAALLARGSHPVLKVGSTGEAVLRLQRALTATAKPTPIDGVYSTRTAKAVTKYQKKHGLPATGVVTAAVWDALG